MTNVRQIIFDGQKFFDMECSGNEWCNGCGDHTYCESFCVKPRDTVFAADELPCLGRAINLCEQCIAATMSGGTIIKHVFELTAYKAGYAAAIKLDQLERSLCHHLETHDVESNTMIRVLQAAILRMYDDGGSQPVNWHAGARAYFKGEPRP